MTDCCGATVRLVEGDRGCVLPTWHPGPHTAREGEGMTRTLADETATHKHVFYLTRTRTLPSGLVVYIGKCECGTEERITYTGRAI